MGVDTAPFCAIVLVSVYSEFEQKLQVRDAWVEAIAVGPGD